MTQAPRGRVAVLRQWDGVLLQTASLHPAASHAALIDITPDPWPDDGGFAPEVAAALAEALVGLGRVAGRWLDDVPPDAVPGTQMYPPPRRPMLDILSGKLPPIVVSRNVAIVAGLLDQGWAVQAQTLLLLAEGDAAPAVDALQRLDDWGGFAFPAPVWAMLAPGVDGDVMLVAAGDGPGLESVLATMLSGFAAAGFADSPG